ncbi:MAG: NHL repeat-containing protein, partial [Candidatus Omnitrophica bacterium]|nr:NHL repeat-containing protein [Candidatus Omnitrophota bacterium]
HRIQEFDYSGNFLSSFGSFGTDSGQFNNPIDVAVDSAGNIFIADFMNNRIHKFDNQFNTLVIQDSGLYRPQTMAIDSRGNLYVNEISNPTIKKYDNDLNLLLEWGRGGSYPDAIGGSQSLAIDSLDRIHIVAHSRVVIFDTLGNFIDAIFEDASGDTFFTNPTDISILGNKISVIDTYQILEFDIEGNLITKWGAKNYYKLIILPNNHIWATYLTDQLIYRYQRR